MATTSGSVDPQGSPRTRISISPEDRPGLSREFEATIDTGFTGFVQMPLAWADAVGLVAVGELPVTYGDGSTSPAPIAWARLQLGSETRDGFVHLEAGTAEVLVGVHFLRLFRKTLVFSAAQEEVLLVDRSASDLANAASS
jgi:predicted aspartyl protease